MSASATGQGQAEVSSTAVSRLTIGDEAAGQRLDNYLFKLLKGVPKSRVYRMLREGEVRANGRRVQPDYRLETGDELRIPPIRTAVRPPEENLPKIGKSLLGRIIYRDDGLLVLDKPAGQAVHGGSGISLGIIEQLRRELPEQRFMELVHRLDRETSGVLLVALKRSALVELHRMLRDGEVRKTYLALAIGHWRDPVRHVKLPLHKFHTEDGERRVMVRDDGQHAHTIFRLRERYSGYSLLEAELKTGRTHQIRVHLASLKHPIALDDKYGDFELNRALKKQGLKRMFLHAARLEMRHPLTGAPLVLEAPLPPDLQGFLQTLTAAAER
jgi:23S rRNA pseudouridine955/2504/2580 synthase